MGWGLCPGQQLRCPCGVRHLSLCPRLVCGVRSQHTPSAAVVLGEEVGSFGGVVVPRTVDKTLEEGKVLGVVRTDETQELFTFGFEDE